jgi:hypothetical protein
MESMHFINTLGAAIFAAFGAGLLGWFAWALPMSWFSRNWPSVSGEVIGAKIGTLIDKTLVQYRAEIRYRYTVEATDYTSSRVVFGDFPTVRLRGPHRRAALRSTRSEREFACSMILEILASQCWSQVWGFRSLQWAR